MAFIAIQDHNVDMAINQNKQLKLQRRMKELGILEEELTEKFILGSGSGGQKVNKTASSVYLKHNPTGLEVKCQQARSRELNRYRARQELCERFAAQILKEKTEKQQKIEKLRRQKRRRSKRAQAKMLDEKRHHGEKKSRRQSPRLHDE